MRYLTQIRFSNALWAFIAGTILGLFTMSQYGMGYEANGSSVASLGASGILMMAPVIAAAAAWQAGRLRRAGWTVRPHQRSLNRVILDSLWPLVLAGWLSLATCIAASMVAHGYVGLPNLLVVIPAITMVIAAAVSGFALGWVVREIIAVPVLLAGWFYILAFPPALDPVWLRHLFVLNDCCGSSMSPNPVVTLAIVLTSASIILLSVIALRTVVRTSSGRSFRTGSVLLGVGAMASLLSGVMLVSDLGPNPTVARTGTLLCAAGIEPKIQQEYCVWPENTVVLERVNKLGSGIFGQIHDRTGITVPKLLTQSEIIDQTAGERSIVAMPKHTDDDIVAGLGRSAIPVWSPQCMATLRYSDDEEPIKTKQVSAFYELDDLSGLWWSDQALRAHTGEGFESSGFLGLVGDELPKPLKALWSLELEAQTTWITEATQTILDCDISNAQQMMERM